MNKNTKKSNYVEAEQFGFGFTTTLFALRKPTAAMQLVFPFEYGGPAAPHPEFPAFAEDFSPLAAAA